jgi:hypothetical protein
MEMSNEIRIVRNPLISDEDQIAELEFAEAQEKFCEASCRWGDSKQQSAMEEMTECEVKLLHAFCRGRGQSDHTQSVGRLSQAVAISPPERKLVGSPLPSWQSHSVQADSPAVCPW